MVEVELNTAKLDKLMALLSTGKVPTARVGILGAKNHRSKGESKSPTNAEIGAKHEFGLDGMPMRSFLRMPLTEFLGKYLEKAGAFTEAVLKDVMATASLTPWIKKIGIVGEQVVADAFQTGGFGKWKPSDMSRKRNHQTLVETQQLRNSITSEVVE